MVFDVAKPVRIDKAFVVDAADGAPARLVLDLVADRPRQLPAQDRARQQARRAPSRRPPRTAAPIAAIRGRWSCSIPATAASIPAPRRRAANWRRTSCSISPSGCATGIEKAGKYRVLMTRSDDTFVPLAERVRIARNAGASLFVSIHADSLPRSEGDAQGATVYTLSDTASDSEAARLAEEENRADVIAGVDLKAEPDDVAGILIDLAQRETKTFSRAIRPQAGRRHEGGDAAAQEAAQIGRLPRAAGAGRAVGAGRTRLRVEPAGPAVAAVRHAGATAPPTRSRRRSTATSPPTLPALAPAPTEADAANAPPTASV